MATVVATNPPVRNSYSNEVMMTADFMGDKRGEQLHEHSEQLLGDWIMVKRRPRNNSNHTKPKGSYGFKEKAIITNNGLKEKSLPTKDDLQFSLVNSFSQAITFSITRGHVTWFCSAVYASHTFYARHVLWDRLISLRASIRGPWMIIGDMNEILTANEVLGGNFCISRANLLSNMMSQCDIMDLDSVNGLFTWRRNVRRCGHVRKKLDRCMVDIQWRFLFPHALLELLPPHNSDHNPLMLSCSKAQSQKTKLFQFQAAWISHPDYSALIQSTWHSSTCSTISKMARVKEESKFLG
ncbi:unnamed protein product [Lupinus luteus]|uniref:Uncharacterized protein n=1 Tax=Lupinus luteus TaxID=3873 RepID=A0AAV1VRW5_LUPLU